MKTKTSLFILVVILLASCAQVPTIVPTATVALIPTATKTFTPEPTATSAPTLMPTPTEIPMNPDWLRGLRIPLGETPQFPKELKRQIFCAVDVKSFRNVSIMYADLEVLRVVDCYYPDAADKTQHITLPLASYNPSLNWYYSLGATTFTKGLGKPGEPYIDNTIKWLMDVASPAGKYLVVWFFLAGQSGQSADYNAYFEQATAKFGAPSQDFLATGNPDSFPDFKNAKDLVFPSQMAINSGE